LYIADIIHGIGTPCSRIVPLAQRDVDRAGGDANAHSDQSDGGQYLGYLTRAGGCGGSFGSFPLYDDYGDGADR